MSTVAIEYNTPRMVVLRVTEDAIVADLSDWRTVCVPPAWSWRLSEATPAQRNHFELSGSGLRALARDRRRHQRSRHAPWRSGALSAFGEDGLTRPLN